MTDDTWRPMRSRHLVARETEGTTTLRDVEGQDLLALNDTALAVWQLCDGSVTVEEMVGAMTVLFDADPDVIAADVHRVIRQLHRLDLLR